MIRLILLSFIFAACGLHAAEWDFSAFRREVGLLTRSNRLADAETRVRAAITNRPAEFRVHALLGELLDLKGDKAGAVKAYTRALDMAPDQADRLFQTRGELHFKMGMAKESAEDFTQLILRNPRQGPNHWQRGISFYYADQFTFGRRQFESHQTVNPNDVENAVWHFLCVAREENIQSARTNLIPISGDSRVPMAQIHRLFSGKATEKEVLEAAAGELPGPRRESAEFYAALYLGLYHEVMQQPKESLAWMEKAAKLADIGGYMGDVARVHLMLRKPKAP